MPVVSVLILVQMVCHPLISFLIMLKISLLCLRINTNMTKIMDTPKYSTIYLTKNLSYLRKLKSINQKEMAKMLNIARSTYASYESGKSEPSLKTLLLISDFFKVSINDLCIKNLETDEYIEHPTVELKNLKIDENSRIIIEMQAKIKVLEDFIKDSVNTMMETVKRIKTLVKMMTL